MPMMFEDKYSEIAPRLINWLGNANTGNSNVAILALDLLNRALKTLEQEAPRGWVYLTKDRVELVKKTATPENGGLEYALPADIGVLLTIYTDSTGTGKPTVYYSRNGKISSGFSFNPNFTTAGGYDSSVRFYYTPENVPYCCYQTRLSNFTGTGTEYSPFPAQLLMLEAQKIRCAEKGLGAEWQMLKASYDEFLSKFKDKNQNISSQVQTTIKDAWGNPLTIPTSNLCFGLSSRTPNRNRNDMDVK